MKKPITPTLTKSCRSCKMGCVIDISKMRELFKKFNVSGLYTTAYINIYSGGVFCTKDQMVRPNTDWCKSWNGEPSVSWPTEEQFKERFHKAIERAQK